MNRRTFIGALLTTVAAFAISKEIAIAPTVALPLDKDDMFVEFGTLDGMAYQHLKSGEQELTMYVLVDGRTGLAQASPQNILHVWR